ncbi:MAG: L-histidine N(alpha)-methyltransferase, partial [Patescibacteria group bacterium]
FVSDFKDFDDIIGALRSVDYQDNIVLLLGETLSHYDINELLHTLSEPMFSGDILIIGNGYRVGKRFVAIEKYKDSLFNEWFINIMRGLSFKDSEVEYDVRFANDRLEAFYKILADKTVSLGGKKVEFKKGDEVVVATQNKMFLDELKKFCKMYFSEVEILADEQKEYCLVVCKK